MKKLKVLGMGFILFICLCYVAFAEDITLTTYYPAPYGVYNQMVTRTLGVGDTDADNDLDSNDAPDPAASPGDVWIAGHVGIGTTNPGAILHVSSTDEIGWMMVSGDTRPWIQWHRWTGDDGFAVGMETGETKLYFNYDNPIGVCDLGIMVLDGTNGNVGIGTGDPETPLHVTGGDILLADDTERALMLRIASDTAYYNPLIHAKRSGGTLASPTQVINNDSILELWGQGHNGVGVDTYDVAGSITLYVDGDVGSNDMPGKWVFSTTPDGSDSPRCRRF